MHGKPWTKVWMHIKNIFPTHGEKELSEPSAYLPAQTILEPDILWRRFDMISSNKAVSTQSRLAEIKTCSHVCREWRQILLNSSPIWGRLLKLGYGDSQNWIDEILRRSKSAPLWFDARFDYSHVGQCRVPPRVTDEYFVALLDRCWERMEAFNWRSDLDASYYPQNVWTIFQRPAPILKRFAVDVPSYRGLFDNIFNTPIFSDCAPRLEELENNIIRHGTLGKSWFKHLRAITVRGSYRSNSGNFLHLMDILVDLPQLESLDASTAGDIEWVDMNQIPNSPLNLPSLVEVHVVVTLNQYVYFISRARPAKGCSMVCTVFADTRDNDVDEAKRLFQRLRAPLNRLIENHVTCHPSGAIDSLRLDLDYGQSFTFSCCGSNKKKYPAFHIRICYSNDSEESIVTRDVLSEIYATFIFQPILEDVKCLDVTYLGFQRRSDRDNDHILDYMPLLQAMPSVKCLHIDRFLPIFWRDFVYYNEISLAGSETYQFPFPNLDTVFTNIFSYAKMGRSPFAELQELLRYWKVDPIYAIKKLPRVELDRKPVNFTALASLTEEFEDLEIIHRST